MLNSRAEKDMEALIIVVPLLGCIAVGYVARLAVEEINRRGGNLQ